MKTHLGTIMTRAVLVGLIGAIASFSASAEDRSVRKTAEAIRSGEINVGKEYSLKENGRFHTIHAGVLGLNGEPLLDIKCGGCHSTDQYPPSYLYLRKDEFPRKVDGEKVRAVQRHFCIGCHSSGSLSTVFYNPKK